MPFKIQQMCAKPLFIKYLNVVLNAKAALNVFLLSIYPRKMTIQLRPWQQEDLDDLIQYANNPKIAQNLTNQFPYPYTRLAGAAFIEMAQASKPIHIMAISLDGKAIGAIGIHPQTDVWSYNAELGYWIAEPFWGKGLATQAVQQIVDYGFEHFELTRIFARPFGRNKGSQRVLEKAGFTLEASLPQTIFKNGQWEDELIYGLKKSK